MHARFKDSEPDGITSGLFEPNSVDQVSTGTAAPKDPGLWTARLTLRMNF